MFFFNGVVTKLVACASNDRITMTLINLVLVAAVFLLVFAGAASPMEGKLPFGTDACLKERVSAGARRINLHRR